MRGSVGSKARGFRSLIFIASVSAMIVYRRGVLRASERGRVGRGVSRGISPGAGGMQVILQRLRGGNFGGFQTLKNVTKFIENVSEYESHW